MKKVFLTPSIFFALIDRSHQKHQLAAAYFRYFTQEKYYLFTDYLSIMEAYAKISEYISPSLGKEFVRAVVLSSVNIIYPTESDLKAAAKALSASRDSSLNLREAQISVLASKNNISQVATFDYLHPLFGLSTFSLPV